jgi:DNA-directed RNA polymerase subunit RPC12/RpoP
MISHHCPHCRQTIRLKEDFAGKMVRCPRCQKVEEVHDTLPAPEAKSEPPPPPLAPVAAVRYPCGKCGQMLRAALSAVGHRANCPKCRHQERVPAQPAPWYVNDPSDQRETLESLLLPPDAPPARTVRYHCGQCSQNLRAPADSVGKKARCPKCKHLERVPNSVTEQHDPATDGGGALDSLLEPPEKDGADTAAEPTRSHHPGSRPDMPLVPAYEILSELGRGDFFVSYNGRPVLMSANFAREINAQPKTHPPRPLVVLRDGETVTIQLTTSALGLRLDDVEPPADVKRPVAEPKEK